jgi:hypothetical protein
MLRGKRAYRDGPFSECFAHATPWIVEVPFAARNEMCVTMQDRLTGIHAAVCADIEKIPLPELQKMSGKSRRMLIYAREGRCTPHRKTPELPGSIVRKLGLC